MNRRDLLRNSVLTTIGVATIRPSAQAREFPPGFDASTELARSDWKPLLLDDHQNETLIALSDAVIPATDTPGAKAALVNRFLDLVMAAESAGTQRAFFEALSYIDGASRERYQVAFLYLTPEQKNDFLSLLAYPHTQSSWGEQESDFHGYEHFSKLKNWIADAYYSSPSGLKDLGWDGSFPHGVFSGCEHAEGHPVTATEKE